MKKPWCAERIDRAIHRAQVGRGSYVSAASLVSCTFQEDDFGRGELPLIPYMFGNV